MCRSSGNWLGVGEAEGRQVIHAPGACSDLQAFSEAHVILRTGEKPSEASRFPPPWNNGYDSVTHTHSLSLSLSLSQDTLENVGIPPRRIHNNLLAMMSFKRDWKKWGRDNSTLFASFSHGCYLFFFSHACNSFYLKSIRHLKLKDNMVVPQKNKKKQNTELP